MSLVLKLSGFQLGKKDFINSPVPVSALNINREALIKEGFDWKSQFFPNSEVFTIKSENIASLSFSTESVSGVESWVRTFVVDWVESPLILSQGASLTPLQPISSNWWVVASTDYPLLASLQQAFNRCQGNGIVVCLPQKPQKEDFDLLLTEAKALIAESSGQRFVLVQHDGGGSAFARTFYLENPHIPTCVVDVPLNHPLATQWVVAEARSVKGYQEAYYSQTGKRYIPRLSLLPTLPYSPSPSHSFTLSDVLLVTGAGITDECALSLAQAMGVRLAFLDITVDLTDSEAVKEAIEQIQNHFGTITAILYSSDGNTTKLIRDIDKNDFLCNCNLQVQGLQNLLTAIDPTQLRLLITSSSSMTQMGLPGEADSALANEGLSRLVKRFKMKQPQCRCLNLEGTVLAEKGTGVAILRRLISQALPETSIIVSGRFGNLSTLKFACSELPLQRFLEISRVYYPGIELVVDVELSVNTDPYLNDYIYQGERIFPSMMGLEAMAQVVMTLLRTAKPPIFEEVYFHHPIVVNNKVNIRIAALVQESGKVKVVLRSEKTAFRVNHFEAICTASHSFALSPLKSDEMSNLHSFNPQQHLYGELFFEKGRFQRLRRYKYLGTNECVAEIAVDKQTQWFSPYLSNQLVLGDPGVRNAIIQALRSHISQMIFLPIKIDRLTIYSIEASNTRFVVAKEREHLKDIFIYDLDIIDVEGKILEHWEGLQLKTIRSGTVLKPSQTEPILAKVCTKV